MEKEAGPNQLWSWQRAVGFLCFRLVLALEQDMTELTCRLPVAWVVDLVTVWHAVSWFELVNAHPCICACDVNQRSHMPEMVQQAHLAAELVRSPVWVISLMVRLQLHGFSNLSAHAVHQ